MKTSIKKPMIKTGSWLLAASCASILSIVPQAQAVDVPAAVNDHVPLGTVYNSYSGKFLNFKSVQGQIEQSGSSYSNILGTSDMTFRSLSSRLSGEITANANFRVVQASAGGGVALDSASDDYSSNWVFSVINVAKSEVLAAPVGQSAPILSTAGVAIAALNQSGLSAADLVEMVGTDYVSRIKYGSQLFVSMKMDFVDKSDKIDVTAKINVNASGVVSGEAALDYLSESAKQSVKITVTAHQYGGDPLHLMEILPTNILHCTLNDPAPCFTLFSNAVEYAKSEGAWVGTGFSEQVLPAGTANVIGYSTTSYAGSSNPNLFALLPLSSLPVTDNDATLGLLESRYAAELTNGKRAQMALTHYASALTTTQRDAIADIKTKTTNNAFALASIVKKCSDLYLGSDCANLIAANCPISGTAPNQVIGCLESYDADLLEIELVMGWAHTDALRDNLKSQGLQNCKRIVESADPYSWDDNWLCSNIDLDMIWRSAGPGVNETCTQINEADPHTWDDNYLCLPTDSSYEFAWANHDGIRGAYLAAGYQCTVNVDEPTDPAPWGDNYLCHRKKIQP